MPVGVTCGAYPCMTGDMFVSSEGSAVTAGLEHIPTTAGWENKYAWANVPRACACA